MNLTLLSLLVVTDAWFLNLGKSKSTESVKAATAQGARKVILVAKKVYVPMYADEDTVSSVADRLLPISSAVLTASEADGRQQQEQQQQQMVPYPPPASYAMYAPATSAPVVADSAVPQYAIYPAVAEPQYVQFGVGPSQVKLVISVFKLMEIKIVSLFLILRL